VRISNRRLLIIFLVAIAMTVLQQILFPNCGC
jgi:hypothetical protein